MTEVVTALLAFLSVSVFLATHTMRTADTGGTNRSSSDRSRDPKIRIDLPLFREVNHVHRRRVARRPGSSFQIGVSRGAADHFDAACNLAHMPHKRAELNKHPNYQQGCANARRKVLYKRRAGDRKAQAKRRLANRTAPTSVSRARIFTKLGLSGMCRGRVFVRQALDQMLTRRISQL
jgi:hypothetical protein